MLVVEPLVHALATAVLRAALQNMRRRGAGPSASPVQAPEDPASWIGLDYIHDRVLAQLDQQSKLWEQADGRLRLILGVIGIVFAATLGLLPRGTLTLAAANGSVSSVPVLLPFLVGASAIAGLVLFAIAGLVAVVAYWPRAFNWPPTPESLRRYTTTREREIKLTVLDQMLDAYKNNELWLERKFVAFRLALVITALAAAALGASVIIQFAQVTRAWGQEGV
jgi:hypothetical protein